MRNITGPLFGFLVTFLFCIVIVAIPVSCGGTDCKDPKNASSAVCVVESTLLECAGGDVTGVVIAYTPVVEGIIHKGLNPDGSINYSAIEGDLVTAVAKFGWCVVSSVFDHYMNPPPAGSGSGMKVTAPGPTPAAAKDAFGKLRAKVAPGLKVHTATGATL